MRAIVALLVLFLAGPGPAAAAEEDWKEYEYPDLSFTVHFPADPIMEMAPYEVPGGRSVEARIYTVRQDSGVFKLIVADLPEGGPDEQALLNHAVGRMSTGGVVKLDIPHRIRQVYG